MATCHLFIGNLSKISNRRSGSLPSTPSIFAIYNFPVIRARLSEDTGPCSVVDGNKLAGWALCLVCPGYLHYRKEPFPLGSCLAFLVGSACPRTRRTLARPNCKAKKNHLKHHPVDLEGFHAGWPSTRTRRSGPGRSMASATGGKETIMTQTC